MSDLRDQLKDALRDQYAIDQEIGRGGMATVYLALDLKHNRKVAVKVLDPELAKTVTAARFLREIEMAAGLAHPNIVPVYDSGEAGGFLYYVMPFIEGETLQRCLREQGRFPAERALQAARDVASALAYAHKQNIIHRDIKPGNILFVEGHAVVTDFGIGKAMCDACEDDITLIGSLVGTPHYMSPEQAGGDTVDQRTDVYSLGCVLYEMLSGDLPYPADNAQAAMARHAIDPVPSIRAAHPEVPEQLDAVITKALAKHPAERYESAAAFLEALGQVGKLRDTGLWPSPPTEEAPAAAPAPRARRAAAKVAVGAALALLIAGGWWAVVSGGDGQAIDSLAVLPFTSLSGDADQEYFVDGMHDLLISELAQIGALTVISRTSVLQYRDTDRSVPDIARALNVDAVVEGSVYRGGDSVRINAQLIAARPERHLWAETYAGTVEGMFALQAEVARAIAREIELEVTPQDEARLAAAPTVGHGTHDAYLRARFHHARGTVEGFEEAIRYYGEALAQSPDFAPAHAGLALSLHLLGVYGGRAPATTEPQAMMHAEKALDLDPALAEAHAVLAGIKSMYEWDWAAAERAYRRAIDVDRSSASARQWYAYHLTSVGRHEEAIAQARRGLELDPLNPMGRVILADQLVNARRYDEAVSALTQAVEIEPDFEPAHDLLEWIDAQLGRYDEAVALRVARLARQGAAGAEAADRLEQAYAARGSRGYWEWKLEQLQRAAETGYVGPSKIAAVHAALGDSEAAMRWLERAYDERDGVEMLKVWPGYDPLRGDPQFANLLRRMAFPD